MGVGVVVLLLKRGVLMTRGIGEVVGGGGGGGGRVGGDGGEGGGPSTTQSSIKSLLCS